VDFGTTPTEKNKMWPSDVGEGANGVMNPKRGRFLLDSVSEKERRPINLHEPTRTGRKKNMVNLSGGRE